MTYYVGNMPAGDHLMHYGTKGMKWGRRRYQNPDGSLTAAGRVRYGVSNAYSRARSGVRSAGNRTSSWYKKNKKTIKKVGTAVGVGAAAAGATYLGMRYGKNVAKAARNAGSRFSNMYNAHRVRFPQKALPGAVKGSRAKNAFKSVGSTARKAAGATGDAFRGIGYHTRRAGAKAKNAARNVGYKAGNVKGNAKRAASKAGTAAKNAAYKASSKARTTATRAKNTARNAKNIPGNAKRVAYNLKSNKAYRVAAGLRAVNAAYNVGAGTVYYRHARKRGASKGAAAGIGAARTFGGTRAGMYAGGAHAVGTTAYKAAKRYNSPSAKRARANYRKRKKKSRK